MAVNHYFELDAKPEKLEISAVDLVRFLKDHLTIEAALGREVHRSTWDGSVYNVEFNTKIRILFDGEELCIAESSTDVDLD